MLREYPDGSYGLDLGGGYDLEPQGDIQPPAPYREDYRSTPYGPSLGRGFEVFPSSLNYGKPPPKKTEDEKQRDKELKGYVFHEATTSPRGSELWGVSGNWHGKIPQREEPGTEPSEAVSRQEEGAVGARPPVLWHGPSLKGQGKEQDG
ncbi:MAG: hypothetical protein GF392_02835 [Candidatus Omnitrophica bacterium]|nr:hypothetical protein [Candidatus Omnitrophota bacterium]